MLAAAEALELRQRFSVNLKLTIGFRSIKLFSSKKYTSANSKLDNDIKKTDNDKATVKHIPSILKISSSTEHTSIRNNFK